MVDIAGWIALAATCVAALMTASNLGARVTGWGFVIFTVGALAWIVVGFVTGQTQLLYSNIFLAAVDVLGIWRWLGRRARISDAARAEEARSTRLPGDNLFSVAGLDGLPVKSREGDVVAHAVDALAACTQGRIGYLIVRVGGVGGLGETLHRLPWADVRIADGEVRTDLPAAAIAGLPEVNSTEAGGGHEI
jgi:hypothetical protein